MVLVSGRCENIEFCTNATTNRVIKLPEDAAFECPQCGEKLTLVTNAAKTARNPVIGFLQLGALGAVVGVLAWKATTLGGLTVPQPVIPGGGVVASPGAGIAPPSAAPAAPSTPALPTPVPAQTAAAEPPAMHPVATAALVAAPASLAETPPRAPAADSHAHIVAAPPQLPPPIVAPAPPPAPVAPAKPAPAPPAMRAPAPAPAVPMPASPIPAAAEPPAAAVGAPHETAGGDDAALRFQSLTSGAEKTRFVFKFAKGAVELDNPARQTAAALRQFVVTRHIAPSRLIVAGFTDVYGTPAVNLAISQARADAVALALGHLGIKPGREAAFGAALPLGDNRTNAGRTENRRVEVYIGPGG